MLSKIMDVRRRPSNAPKMACEEIATSGTRGQAKGRPKKSWREVIKNDLSVLQLIGIYGEVRLGYGNKMSLL